MGLPQPDLLSLLQAVDYISTQSGESENIAGAALFDALKKQSLKVSASTKSIRHLDSNARANAEEDDQDPNGVYTFFGGNDFIPAVYWHKVGYEKMMHEAKSGALNAIDGIFDSAVRNQFISYNSGVIEGYYINPVISRSDIDVWLASLLQENKFGSMNERIENSSKDSTKNIGRPSPKMQIESTVEALQTESEFWNLPRVTQAQKVSDKCGKLLGEKGWGSRAVQNHIMRYEKASRRAAKE